MSIKLSIKDLKDLLKLQNKTIKKRKRRKRSYKPKNETNIRSSSDHIKSGGFTSTSNEATELIRLQREALEAKLKTDKEKKAKDDNDQLKADNEGGLVSYNPLKNNGGNNSLRFKDIDDSINHIFMNFNQYRPPQLGDTVNMVQNGRVNDAQTNTQYTPATFEELKDEPSEKVPHRLDNNNTKAEEKAVEPFIKVIDPNEKFYTKSVYNYTKEQLIAYINQWDGTLRSELNLLTVPQLKAHVKAMQDRLGDTMNKK